MNEHKLKERIRNLSIWKKGDQRAPHKPLLILYAFSQLQRDNRLLAYKEVREKLKTLLIEFGPARKLYHPEHPFVRLVNDEIWEINSLVARENIKDGWLLKNNIYGGFKEEVYNLLIKDRKLVKELAEIVLSQHFPETIHEDILREIGLDFTVNNQRHRDPDFRNKILRAYEYSCAVCGFDVRLGSTLVAVEAAHIKWHQAGGPDIEENGIALCSMHHKLFDRGVFTLSNSKKLLVAEEAHGSTGFDEWLMRYHNKSLRNPINPDYYPKDSFVHWHVKEVFRSPARYRLDL